MGREQQFLKGVNRATKVYVHKVWKDEHKKLRSDLEKLNKEIEETLYEKSCRVFLCHRKLCPMTQKNAPRDAHAREEGICRKRPRSTRECAKAHSILYCVQTCHVRMQALYRRMFPNMI